MTEPNAYPLVDRVFHPTDFSEASHVAFDHALAIAIARKATLTVLNASKGFRGDDWSRFPGVSDTLKRWGLLDESSERRDIFDKLSVKVKKLGVDASDPADVILDFLGDHPNDLVVMATEAREGLPRLLKGSVAEKVTRASGARFLLVPTGCPGFVSKGDGSLSLKRVLVPVAETPDPNAAALAATRAAEALGNLPVELHAVHVGEDMPYVDLPLSDDWTWHRYDHRRTGQLPRPLPRQPRAPGGARGTVPGNGDLHPQAELGRSRSARTPRASGLGGAQIGRGEVPRRELDEVAAQVRAFEAKLLWVHGAEARRRHRGA
jgi:nucleotide-binding universal stress UspA family protein